MSDPKATKQYRVTATGRVAGVPRQEGDVIDLHPAAAQYENVELVAAKSRTAQAEVTNKDASQTDKAVDAASQRGARKK